MCVCVCTQLGGPIWSAPMHDTSFVRGLLSELEAHKQDYYTADRIKGLLTVVSEVHMYVHVHSHAVLQHGKKLRNGLPTTEPRETCFLVVTTQMCMFIPLCILTVPVFRSCKMVSCILMYVYVAPPTPVGAWSMALGLRQRFDYYCNVERSLEKKLRNVLPTTEPSFLVVTTQMCMFSSTLHTHGGVCLPVSRSCKMFHFTTPSINCATLCTAICPVC